MGKSFFYYIIIVIIFLPTFSFAQDNYYKVDSLEVEQIPLSKEDSIVYNQFVDFVNRNKKPDIIPFNPYFLPPVFDGKFGFDIIVEMPTPDKKDRVTLARDSSLLNNLYIPSSSIILFGKTPLKEKAFHDYLRNNMQSIRYSYADFDKEVEKIEEIKPNIFKSIFSISPEVEINETEVSRSSRYVPKRRYWKIHGNSYVQVSQNEISENWSSGGTSSFNLRSEQNISLDYAKNKIQFKNFIEWKLSLNKEKDKEKDNEVKIGDDLFRIYSSFGLKAFYDKWFYSSNLEIKTQLFSHHVGDTEEYASKFFSPTQINMGILGMKYELERKFKKDRYKKINLSVDISPLSIQSKWVFNDDIDPKRHGIEENKNHIMDLGSTMNAKFNYSINRQIFFSSRFRFFTNYEKVVLESENELKFAFNEFFSTRLFFFGIFDDSKEKHEDLGYFQYNQVLSFGFNYKW